MRGLKGDRTASVVIRGRAFIQNLRRGHYKLGIHAPNDRFRVRRTSPRRSDPDGHPPHRTRRTVANAREPPCLTASLCLQREQVGRYVMPATAEVGSLESSSRRRFSGIASRIARRSTYWVIALALLMIVVSFVYADGTASSTGEGFRIVASLLAISGASALFGGFLGLLFGMPRAVEVADPAKARSRFLANSNLLKVSDWVTTIVVGLSLVNLGRVPQAATRLEAWLAPGLGAREGSGTAGVLVTIVGLVGAFVMMYIWTIVVLRSDLEQGEYDIERFVSALSVEVAKGGLTSDDIRTRLQGASDQVVEEAATSRLAPAMLREQALAVRDERASQ